LRLRSAVGERKKWSAGGETAGTEPERNAAAEPQTEAARVWRIKKSTDGQVGCDVGRSVISEGRSRHLRPAGSGGTDLFISVNHPYFSRQLFGFISQ
jgi:hypothetical protein